MNKISALFLKLIIIFVIPFQLALLYERNIPNPTGIVAGIQVIATIGDRHLDLYGYTSPQALITLEGVGIYDNAYADSNGYFILSTLYSSSSPREACLSSKDQLGRLSSPVCLPPFPVDSDIKIGPVIMPPTVSLDKKDYFVDDQVIFSGQTVPNTEIDLSMFGDADNNFVNVISRLSLIKPVEAFTFPKLKVNSDNKGNFSVNLPSSTPEKFRLFAQTNFNKSISSNSNRLNLEIMPIWMIIVKNFWSRLLEIAIVVEIIFIIHVLKGYFEEKSIVLYQSLLPTIGKNNLPQLIEY
ncbi:MAG: hypothetical protein ACD_12C00813G0003 [uncultured bacterium]|nr:MAG: hypothetical protein ACD_12C00813G0003 [uncultured bacterium]